MAATPAVGWRHPFAHRHGLHAGTPASLPGGLLRDALSRRLLHTSGCGIVPSCQSQAAVMCWMWAYRSPTSTCRVAAPIRPIFTRPPSSPEKEVMLHAVPVELPILRAVTHVCGRINSRCSALLFERRLQDVAPPLPPQPNSLTGLPFRTAGADAVHRYGCKLESRGSASFQPESTASPECHDHQVEPASKMRRRVLVN